jgi:hypothetical protein
MAFCQKRRCCHTSWLPLTALAIMGVDHEQRLFMEGPTTRRRRGHGLIDRPLKCRLKGAGCLVESLGCNQEKRKRNKRMQVHRPVQSYR